MANTKSAKEYAKDIRKALKTEFPGQKFSVRTSSSSMHSAVDVRYIDGPIQSDVEAVVNRAVASDSYTASYDVYSDCWSGSRFYHVTRSCSANLYQQAIDATLARWHDYLNETPEYKIHQYEDGSAGLVARSFEFSDRVYRELNEIAG